MVARRLIAGISSGKILLGLALVFVIQAVADKVGKDNATESDDPEDGEE